MKRPKYKDKMMQSIYELGLTATYPIPLDFYKGVFGGSARIAWENGYNGLNITRYDKDSIAHAAYMAGKEVKRRESKTK